MADGTGRLRVVVVAPGLPADAGFLELLAEEVDLHLFYGTWPTGTAPPPGAVATELQGKFFPPLVESRRNHLKFVYPGLLHALDEVDPHVVHVLSEPWALFCAQAARWKRKNPGSVLIGHGCDTIWHHGARSEQLIRRLLIRFTLGAMDAYAGENSDATTLATRHGLRSGSPTPRVHTNPRSTRTWHTPAVERRVSARSRLGLSGDTVAVGLVGRLVPEKGVHVFTEAAELLTARGMDATFFIAGQGRLAEDLRQRHGRPVRFLGKLDYPGGMLDLMHGLDVLACPSLATPSWEDQAPRVVIEAAMAGCAVIGLRPGYS